MRRLLLALCAVLMVSGSAHSADSGTEEKFRVGISPQSLLSVNRNDFHAAVKAWSASVIGERQLDIEEDVQLFDSAASFVHAVRDKRVDALQLTTAEFLTLGIEPERVYLLAKSGGAHVRYVLIARADAAFKGIDALAGDELIVHDGRRMELARAWLASLYAGPGAAGAPSGLRREESASKAILQVFFGQAKASIVTRDALELAGELNPQVRRDLVVLAESMPLITNLFVLHPAWQSALRPAVEEAVADLHRTEAGKQVLLVFQGERMEPHPVAVLDQTLAFLRAQPGVRGEARTGRER